MRAPELIGVSRRVGLVAGLAVVTLLLTAPLAWRGASAGPVNTGDGQLSIWNVSWVARALVRDPAHVYDANIFATHTNALAFSEANLPAGALGLPAWWLSKNAYLTYNSSVCLSLLLAALATFGLVKHLTGSPPAAAVTAVLFAFAPFATVRYAHIQLLVTAGLPLALWAMHRFVDRPGAGRALALSLAIAFAGLSCGYYGFFAAIAVGIGLLYYAVARQHWRRPSYVALCVLTAAGTVLAILPFFLPYVDLLKESQPFRSLDDARQYSATFRSYITSTASLHRVVLGAIVPFVEADYPERVLFPGFLASGLAVAAGVACLRRGGPRRETDAGPVSGARETVGFYLLLAAVAAWFSFGPKAWLYTAAYRVVPAWSLLRAPSRFGILVSLAIAVLAGVGLAAWLRRSRRRWLPFAIGLLALADVAAVPWDTRDALPVPAAYRMLASLPPGGVAEFPFFFRPIDFHRHSLYMLYSTVHWHPLVNGYSDHIPEDFKAMVIPVSSFPAWEAFGILRRHGARYVVFHLNLYDHRSREKLLERIDRYKLFLRPMVQQEDVWLYEITEWPE